MEGGKKGGNGSPLPPFTTSYCYFVFVTTIFFVYRAPSTVN